MSFKVEKPGLLSTVQDLGRFGYQKDGVPISGPMDALAHRTANLLLGNDPAAPVLEMTLLGPSLRFLQDQVIALTGAEFNVHINGQAVPVNRPVLVRQGALLEVGQAVKGCRGYLAVAGGIQVPQVLGSASTYVRASLGGWQGRALRQEDVISCFQLSSEDFPYLVALEEGWNNSSSIPALWFPAPDLFRGYEENPVIRVLPGPEYHWFSQESQRSFWEAPIVVSPQSDRMGYRLQGPTLTLQEKREMLSTAVTFGTVQVPPQGNPIVLMADRQTTGGYPRIGQVITADLGILAQARPGQTLRFEEVSLGQAHQLLFLQEQNLQTLKRAVALKNFR